jgi:phage terminase large subunit GpA-like protein
LFIEWKELVKEWLLATAESERGNHELLKTFVNTRLAETWMPPSDQVEENEVLKRREPYVYKIPQGEFIPCEVPDGVLILTAGIDIQDNRAEIEVVGWGWGWESWGIEYRVIHGNPNGQAFWGKVDAYLLKKWAFGDGSEIGITTACVDSGGHYTSDVYKFTKPRESRRIYSIKGMGGMGIPMISRSTQNTRNKALLFILGVDEIKCRVLSNLKIHTAGPGCCHFPLSPNQDDEHRRGYNGEYFRGLVSERRVISFRKGFKKYEWQKLASVRNEPLDCRVYAIAALAILNPNFEAMRKYREKTRGVPINKVRSGAGKPTANSTPAVRKPGHRRGRSSKGVSV